MTTRADCLWNRLGEADPTDVTSDSRPGQYQVERPAQPARAPQHAHHRSYRSRPPRPWFHRGNTNPRRERARRVDRGCRTSGTRTNVLYSQPRNTRRRTVSRDLCGSGNGRQSSGGNRIRQAFPGFLANHFPSRRLGDSRISARRWQSGKQWPIKTNVSSQKAIITTEFLKICALSPGKTRRRVQGKCVSSIRAVPKGISVSARTGVWAASCAIHTHRRVSVSSFPWSNSRIAMR
jgi:hypothetical protein